jgi:sugar lactone lactonase YvrE
MQSGIFAFNPGSGAFTPLVLVDRPGCRFNDATVDAHGRLWASIMEVDAQAGCAAIYLATADLELVTVVDGLSIPNGLAVDLDRQKFFYSDSHPDVQSIWVKPIDGGSGLPGEATLFASTTRLNGRPDGASLDQWGYYWIAGVDGSELYVYGSDGGLHDTIVVPVPAPTKICFAGQNGRTVLVTSKNIGENGGYLARAELPPGMPSGVAQPYWDIGAR